MIPKRIHYCWFGKKPKNQTMKMCMQSWCRVLPDYEIVEWNEQNITFDHPYLEETLRKGLWSKLANYVRLKVLFKYGGIYLDTDVEVIRNLDPLLIDTCFLGFQNRRKRKHWVNCAVLGAESNHHYVKRCMNLLLSVYENEHRIPYGPEIMTQALIDMGLEHYGKQRIGGVKLYPLEYFYPYLWTANFHPSRIRDTTYTIHRWQLSHVDHNNFTLKTRIRTWLYNRMSTMLAITGGRNSRCMNAIADFLAEKSDQFLN